MLQKQIENTLQDVKLLRYFHSNGYDLAPGAWFLFETRPTPNKNLDLVVSDIIRGNEVNVSYNGTVYHVENCTNKNHELPKVIQNCLKNLSEQSFRVAIWEGHQNVLDGQPVFIVLEPELSFLDFPDHPHLNTCILRTNPYFKGIYLPDSVCYSKSHDLLSEPYIRIRESFIQVCIWLLRHQVWVATREQGNPIWIGSEDNTVIYNKFHRHYNPFKPCYCNSGKIYRDCHLDKDFSEEFNNQKLNLNSYLKFWQEARNIPHHKVLDILKKKFDKIY